MPANFTFRILADDARNLWVSTTNGLVRLNPESGEIRVFKKEHGLITNQFNYNSSWKDPEGRMYFGMVRGMISFDPREISEIRDEVKVWFTSMTIFDEMVGRENTIIPVAFSNHIDLKYNQSSFSIGFSPLSYIAPAITEYAFRLSGLHDDWITLKNNHSVNFTKLPPGHYVLRVKGRNISGIWNATPTSVSITIAPPWWFSKLARVIYFLIGIGVCGLIIRSVIRRNRKNVRQKMAQLEYEKEKELHQAKINFFINIAHEIRTPVTLITGPLEKVVNNCVLPDDTRHYLSIMEKNSKRLLQLVDQLLDFRDTELQGFRLSFERKNVVGLLVDNFNRFREAALENNLLFEIITDIQQLFISLDEEAFVKMISNLFLNAIKYARSRVLVKLSYSEGDNFLIIDVINDGDKIPAEIREKIFEPFFRGGNAEFKPGTGLGLPIVKSLAGMHSGTLELIEGESELITFRLKLPVNEAGALERSEKEEVRKLPGTARKEFTIDPARPVILVVEDHEEMQHYIGQEINQMYNVLTASNGAEALACLRDNPVQLIVSDIMMPVMDGITFLRRVKTDLDYSHIPVILLTAKTTVQAHLEGLESGADAYIEKPFKVEILLAQIANLLDNRNSMRRHYFNSPIANLKSIAYTKADEIFLEQLNDIILANLSNTRLNVDLLSESMNMSRPTLYRKIKAISNLSPNELIRISRLKKAAQLINEGGLSLSEVAEKVGFSSQSYFSRSFSKQFAISPSEYAAGKESHLRGG